MNFRWPQPALSLFKWLGKWDYFAGDRYKANKLVGHGVKIKKLTNIVAMWMAEAAGNFDRATGSSKMISESVANGAYWPDATEYGDYWAKYGTVTE